MKHKLIIFFIFFSFLNLFPKRVNVKYLESLSTKKLSNPMNLFLSPNEDKIVFLGENSKIYWLDLSGIKVSEMGKTAGSKPGLFKKPEDLFIDKNMNIYVLDTKNNRLQIFDKSNYAYPTRVFGKSGSKNGDFKNPGGIWVDDKGDIYVSDTENDRVQVFTNQGIFIMKVGKKGHNKEQLYTPLGIAVDNERNIYVADAGNKRIQIYNENGKFLDEIKNPSMIYPCDLFFDTTNNLLYSTDVESNQIFIFKTDGTLYAKFGSKGKGPGEFDKPYGIYATKEGKIYIADTGNSRIQIMTIPEILENKESNEHKSKIEKDKLEKTKRLEAERLEKEKKENKAYQKSPIDLAKEYIPKNKQKIAAFNFEIIGSAKELRSIRDTACYEVKRNIKKSNFFDICLDDDVKNEIAKANIDPLAPVSLKNSLLIAKNLMAEASITGAVTAYYVEVILTNALNEKEITSAKKEFSKESEISEAASKAIDDIILYYYNNSKKPINAPTGLEVKPGIKSVELTWHDVKQEYKAGYKIYRSENPDNKMTLIGYSSKNEYIDKVPEIKKEYYYKITSINIFGEESEKSLLISCAGLPNPELESVENIKIKTTDWQIDIEWQKSKSKDVKGYRIFRNKSKTGNFTKIAETSELKYTDKTIKADQEYFYYIQTYNKEMTSKNDEIISVKSKNFAEIVPYGSYEHANIWTTTDKNTRKSLTPALKVAEGIKVIILDKKNRSYYKIKTKDGRQGYIYVRFLKIVK